MGIDPVSMAVIGGIGAGVSAYGQYESGQAASAAAAYQAQVAANNAKIARQNAVWDAQAGEAAAVNQGLKTRALIGKETAYAAASGVDVGTGSTTAVRAGTREMGMLDNLTIRSDSAKKAYADEVQAGNFTAESQLDTMKSKQAEIAGDIGAAGSLLSGASTVGGNYLKWQNSFGGSGGSDFLPSASFVDHGMDWG